MESGCWAVEARALGRAEVGLETTNSRSFKLIGDSEQPNKKKLALAEQEEIGTGRTRRNVEQEEMAKASPRTVEDSEEFETGLGHRIVGEKGSAGEEREKEEKKSCWAQGQWARLWPDSGLAFARGLESSLGFPRI
ncbi:hypothetical protein CRG98_005911 [Punica granatum]|uniref:Uncharacterized protein n=1 Tax=Punica granatum TaxID=22663 RepID=A0A2I0KZA9_PUNGR|nr:hypothetical protein CRG98_005911 [Punica granatum]